MDIRTTNLVTGIACGLYVAHKLDNTSFLAQSASSFARTMHSFLPYCGYIGAVGQALYLMTLLVDTGETEYNMYPSFRLYRKTTSLKHILFESPYGACGVVASLMWKYNSGM